MDEHDWLSEHFEEHRTHLRAVAYRMLGSPCGKISEIELLADPARLRELDLAILED